MTGLHIIHNRAEGTIGFAMPSSMCSCTYLLLVLMVDTGQCSVYPTSYKRSTPSILYILGILIIVIIVIVILLYKFLEIITSRKHCKCHISKQHQRHSATQDKL